MWPPQSDLVPVQTLRPSGLPGRTVLTSLKLSPMRYFFCSHKEDARRYF